MTLIFELTSQNINGIFDDLFNIDCACIMHVFYLTKDLIGSKAKNLNFESNQIKTKHNEISAPICFESIKLLLNSI